MELIDKYSLVGADGLFTKRGCKANCNNCSLWSAKGCRVIIEAPTVDAVPVVHGRWKKHEVAGYLGCSNCWDVFVDEEWLTEGRWNYCPNCGAKMDSEE